MKFITRGLIESIQNLTEVSEMDAAELRWNSHALAYQNHLMTIRSQLPPQMQDFCGTALHDSVITSISQTPASKIQIELEASRNPWGPVGCFQLEFSDVKETSPLQHSLGDIWLYEEVHLHINAGFDFRVLLRKSELRIVANGIRLTELVKPKVSS